MADTNPNPDVHDDSVPNGGDHIGIFANSGHHYVFVPIDEADLAQHKELATVCLNDTAPWTTHAEFPWVRYRPGRKVEKRRTIAGYWVAVESNLGRGTRGFVCDPPTPVPPRPVPPTYDEHATPYAFHEINELVPATRTIALRIPVKHPHTGEELFQLPLPPIVWKTPAAAEPMPVDLVIDFGNTRTVALLVEGDPERNFSQNCQPVRFLPRATDYERFDAAPRTEDPDVIVDSWLVLHEPVFVDFWPPAPTFVPHKEYTIDEQTPGLLAKLLGNGQPVRQIIEETQFIPQMFVELSPALFGGGHGIDSARQLLSDAELRSGLNFFLSSPKRYAWDSDPMGFGGEQYWHVLLNRWNPKNFQPIQAGLPPLAGAVLLFMDPDGRHWDIAHPPNERPHLEQRPHASDDPIHPRRDALTWSALTILETAYRQITSEAYRTGHKPFVPRRLRSVLVTVPSGWTGEELDSYRRQWEKAINIFTLAHLQDRRLVSEGGDRPLFLTNLDEAVAAQLPIIYAEMQGVSGKGWIELVGRGAATDARVRIMNLDIGGGTTDISVVEYRDTLRGAAVNLEATLLFKNSSSVAGDALVKRIIEAVLLPQLGAPFVKDAKSRQQFERFFRNSEDQQPHPDPAFRQKFARIVRLVFIPIVNWWLKEVTEGRYGDPEQPNQGLAPSKMLDADGGRVVPPAIIDELNEKAAEFLGVPNFMLLPESVPLNYDQARLRQCVAEEFGYLFESLGRVLAAFDCDLVLVSGKPSELPEIRELLEYHLPLLPQRILFAKGFPVGYWYPLGATDGRIRDAKTPTVVGAALAQAMRGGKILGWRLESKPAYLMTNDNYWGPMPPRENPGRFDQDVYLKPGQQTCTSQMLLGQRLGRKRYPSPHLLPDQVYVLRWKPEHRQRFERPLLEVTLERVSKPNTPETLRLAQVKGTDEAGKPITLNDLELQLCTLSTREFWMDNPSFEIQWPETAPPGA